MTHQSKPLSGITVIAIEQAVAAPSCSVRLADAGARVIKIERAEGETARHYDDAVDGTSTYFTWLNRGKESLVLDLKSSKDLDVLAKLLAKADVLIENLSPGALDRMGFDKTRLKAEFPKLIYLSIVGYGQDTPYANMKAYDMLVQAESGVCAVTGSASEPAKIGVPIADIGTGMSAHAAVLEAIIERSQTGEGKHIEIAMFDCMAEWMSVPFLHFEQGETETARHGMAHATVYPYRPLSCQDGTLLIAVQTQSEWKAFCETVLERPDLIDTPEFHNNAARVANRTRLDAEMEIVFARHTLSEMSTKLQKARIAYANFTEVRDLPNHPALRRTDVSTGNHSVSIPRPTGRDNDFVAQPIPSLGEHSDKIRSELES